MLIHYIRAAMRAATYEILPDEEGFYGAIPGFQGVWANADTLEACRDDLEEVLQEWIIFRLSRAMSLPIVDGIDLNFREREAV